MSGSNEVTEIDFSKDLKLVNLVTRAMGMRRLLSDLETDYGTVERDIAHLVRAKYPQIDWESWIYDPFELKFIRRVKEAEKI